MGSFLPEWLDSVLNQNIQSREYEIICVNDGLTDNSGQYNNAGNSKTTDQRRKRIIKEVRDKGLFPFTPLQEANLKNAFVTCRTDFLGRAYNTLVMNSTKPIGFQMLSLWYRCYDRYKGKSRK